MRFVAQFLTFGSTGSTAGKTTLIDVLALRKTSGEVVGEICLNGHPIEPKMFRRSIGYVEQFDVQSPQLTIRETVVFSAKLRLEESDPMVTRASTLSFIDQTLHMLELKSIEHLQVGDDQSGGLSFEQRKRLSIAVELVSNPSVLFLDEPTSGRLSCLTLRFLLLCSTLSSLIRFGCSVGCCGDTWLKENRTHRKGSLCDDPSAIERDFSLIRFPLTTKARRRGGILR